MKSLRIGLWVAVVAGVAAGLFLMAPDRVGDPVADNRQVPAGDEVTEPMSTPEIRLDQPGTPPQPAADDSLSTPPPTPEVNRSAAAPSPEARTQSATGEKVPVLKVSDMLTHSHDGLVAEPVAGGGEKINLKGRFGSAPVARRNPDGTIVVDHHKPEESPPEED